jgi:hypothetical protein
MTLLAAGWLASRETPGSSEAQNSDRQYAAGQVKPASEAVFLQWPGRDTEPLAWVSNNVAAVIRSIEGSLRFLLSKYSPCINATEQKTTGFGGDRSTPPIALVALNESFGEQGNRWSDLCLLGSGFWA